MSPTSPVSTPATDAPPLGRYSCYSQRYNPATGSYTVVSTQSFDLLTASSYTLTGGSSGSYTYVSSTGEVDWTSGPYDDPGITAEYVGVNTSGHTINLIADGTKMQNCYSNG